MIPSLKALSFHIFSDFSELLNGKGTSKSKMNSGHISNGNSSLYKFILFHLSFVTTIATGIMFWTIYAIDPTALNPKEFYYPLLLNNMHHTIPWIFSLVQIFIFAKREINSFALKIDVIRASEIGMVSLFLVAVCYSLTSLSRKVVFDVFPYPFMNDLTRIQYGIFNMFAIAFGLMISNISTQVLFQIARRMKKQSNLSKEN